MDSLFAEEAHHTIDFKEMTAAPGGVAVSSDGRYIVDMKDWNNAAYAFLVKEGSAMKHLVFTNISNATSVKHVSSFGTTREMFHTFVRNLKYVESIDLSELGAVTNYAGVGKALPAFEGTESLREVILPTGGNALFLGWLQRSKGSLCESGGVHEAAPPPVTVEAEVNSPSPQQRKRVVAEELHSAPPVDEQLRDEPTPMTDAPQPAAVSEQSPPQRRRVVAEETCTGEAAPNGDMVEAPKMEVTPAEQVTIEAATAGATCDGNTTTAPLVNSAARDAVIAAEKNQPRQEDVPRRPKAKARCGC